MLELTAKVKSLQKNVNNFELAMNFMSDEDLKDENLKLRKRVYESEMSIRDLWAWRRKVSAEI